MIPDFENCVYSFNITFCLAFKKTYNLNLNSTLKFVIKVKRGLNFLLLRKWFKYSCLWLCYVCINKKKPKKS